MLDFADQVAIVTGAGRGLGRAHALLLASRGAAVVVNDLGSALDGAGSDPGPAHDVVAEIKSTGGTAIADTRSVATAAGATRIVDAALAAFGRVDIVVNNAGITGGRPVFGDISDDRAMAVLDTHLLGTLHVTQAAWKPMAEQGYGRVVNTSSGVGFFGMESATTYAAAKLGVAGLSRSLALEGESLGIRVNVVAPLAQTRMAAGGVFDALDGHLDPSLVSSVVAYLAHRDCAITGRVLSAGAGRVAEIVFATTGGHFDPGLSPEDVQANLERVLDRSVLEFPETAMDEVALVAACHAS